MTPSLQRLKELVHTAEAKSRAQELGAEVQKAAERLRVAGERAQQAERRAREERPGLERALEEVAGDEGQLKELTRKVTGLIGSGKITPDERRAIEDEIQRSQAELTAKKRTAQTALEAVNRELEEGRRELRAAHETYNRLRRELDQLRPELAAEFVAVDRLASEVERSSPAAQLQALADEIAAGERHYGDLTQPEQTAQLKIWVGRYRRLQDLFKLEDPAAITESDQALLHQTFPRLVGISKVYWPGYIEAFSRNFTTDWDEYIAAAQEEFREAVARVRHGRGQEARQQEEQAQAEERRRQSREALAELEALVATPDFADDEALDGSFQDLIHRVIAGLGAGDPELLRILTPYRERINGKELRALRRHLDLAHQSEATEQEEQALREEFRDLREATRGLKVLMIGGSVREDSRRALESFFEFDALEWEPHEGTRPAMLKSLEERIRNRGVDLILILKEFVGHVVPGRLRPLCEQSGIPCLMVEKGYGTRQVAETLRAGLLKQA